MMCINYLEMEFYAVVKFVGCTSVRLVNEVAEINF